MKRTKELIAMPLRTFILAAGLCGGGAQANLLINGSFEDTSLSFVNNGSGFMTLFAPSNTIPGWNVIANNIAWQFNSNPYGLTASDGTFQVELTGVNDNSFFGSIRQTFATTAGAAYHVAFDLGANNGNCGGLDCTGPMGVNVNIVGVTQQEFKDYDPIGGVQNWETFGLDFTAIAATTTLRFDGIQAGHRYLGLDNVVVTAVPVPMPEPASYVLLLAGLIGLIASTRNSLRA